MSDQDFAVHSPVDTQWVNDGDRPRTIQEAAPSELVSGAEPKQVSTDGAKTVLRLTPAAPAIQGPRAQRKPAGANPIDVTKGPLISSEAMSRQPGAHACIDDLLSNGAGQLIDPAKMPPKPVRVLPDRPDDQSDRLAVGLLVELWRQRQDLRRAEKRLDLQCQAICRRAVGGDKVAAQRLWASLRGKGAEPQEDALLMILAPYTLAMDTLITSAVGIEKQVIKIVRTLPLWTDWAAGVRGVAELSLGGLIGEASRPLSDYRSVSALWKRMGLAVIGDERQRLKKGTEESALHGYSPQRRAFAYVLSTNLMRSQRAGDRYRDVYDRRKAYELARDLPKAHAHNRALRVMVKALLRDAWIAQRAADRTPA